MDKKVSQLLIDRHTIRALDKRWGLVQTNDILTHTNIDISKHEKFRAQEKRYGAAIFLSREDFAIFCCVKKYSFADIATYRILF